MSRFGDTSTPATARLRLLRLEREHTIIPFQAGDEELVCGRDGFALVSSTAGWQHSPDEIARMQAQAAGAEPVARYAQLYRYRAARGARGRRRHMFYGTGTGYPTSLCRDAQWTVALADDETATSCPECSLVALTEISLALDAFGLTDIALSVAGSGCRGPRDQPCGAGDLMADETMTPLRALTIGLAGAMSSIDVGATKLTIAQEALVLARGAIEHLPEGWAVVNESAIRAEMARVDERLTDLAGTTRLLLALRIQADGHAKTLGAAGRIADDRDRVRALYPDMPEMP